jgi:hypothetical protein
MRPLARTAAAAMIFALALVAQAAAQGSDPGPCRQGVLALILMIDAEEQDRSHYRSTAASVVEACGSPPAAKASTPVPSFDKAACSRLAVTMLESIEAGKMGAPEFVAARNTFAQQCRGG